MTNSFKGLYLIDRVPELLWTEVHDVVQEAVIKIIPKKKKRKKAKWLSDGAFKISEKRREVKGKGEKERYTHLNAEFQRIASRDKKAFLSDQCKEIEEHRMGMSSRPSRTNTPKRCPLLEEQNGNRLEISSRKLEIPGEYFMQRWAQ